VWGGGGGLSYRPRRGSTDIEAKILTSSRINYRWGGGGGGPVHRMGVERARRSTPALTLLVHRGLFTSAGLEASSGGLCLSYFISACRTEGRDRAKLDRANPLSISGGALRSGSTKWEKKKEARIEGFSWRGASPSPGEEISIRWGIASFSKPVAGKTARPKKFPDSWGTLCRGGFAQAANLFLQKKDRWEGRTRERKARDEKEISVQGGDDSPRSVKRRYCRSVW